MKAVFEHELGLHDYSIGSHLFAVFLLIATGAFSVYYNVSSAVVNFEYVLASASIIFVIVIPLLTMRSISDERRQKTDQLLYSLPLSMGEIVGGKYLALLAIYVLPVLVIALYPIMFMQYGDVHLLTAYGSLIAFFFLGAALIAVGMFCSSLTENQGIAAGICAVVIVLNYYLVTIAEYVSATALGSFLVLSVILLLLCFLLKSLTRSNAFAAGTGIVIETAMGILYLVKQDLFVGLVPNIMNKLSLFERFYSFVDGDFDITAIVYFLSVAFFFLYLCVQSLEKRRYN